MIDAVPSRSIDGSIMKGGRLSVLGLAPSFFLRPANTDWRHMKLLEEAFAENQQWSFALRHSLTFNAQYNASFLLRTLVNKSLRRHSYPPYLSPLRQREIAAEYDVIYAYGNFPKAPKLPPVLWHCGAVDRSILQGWGVPEHAIDGEIAIKGKCLAACTRAAVTSDDAKQKMLAAYPGFDDKIEVLPFMLPYLRPVSEEFITKKHRTDRFNILFVGRDARRKGLEILLAAFVELRRKHSRVSLTVVTEFQNGAVNIPECEGLEWLGRRSVQEVQELMKAAHIYAMPSLFETYGIVFVEAMAAGAVPVGPDQEPQRSIFDGGSAGSLVQRDPISVYNELDRLVSDEAYRLQKAQAALTKFKTAFSDTAVTARYAAAFERTLRATR